MNRIPISKVYKKFVPVLPCEVLHDDGTIEDTSIFNEDGTTNVLPIDQFSGHPSMINANGFIMNDIMVFEESQSDSVARAALARLKVINSGSLPKDMPVDKCMQRIVPANWGSAAEYMRLQEHFGTQFYNDLKAEMAAHKDKDGTIEFNSNDVPKSD